MSCAQCNAPAGQRCSRCLGVLYCSTACQKAHWPAHKKTCTPAKPAATEVAPVPASAPTPGSAPAHAQGAPAPSVSCASSAEGAGARAYPAIRALHAVWATRPARADNIALFLHGFGDTEQAYATLAQRMAIPNTAALALRGPEPVLDLGHAWYPILDSDGLPIPARPGETRRLRGLAESSARLARVVAELAAAGWPASNLVLVGCGQGAVAALDYALTAEENVAGVAALSGGCYLGECGRDVARVRGWRRTDIPVLVTHGTRTPDPPLAAARTQADVLRTHVGVERVTWREYDKAAIGFSGPDEMRDFWSWLAPLLSLPSAAMEAMARDGTLIEITKGGSVLR